MWLAVQDPVDQETGSIFFGCYRQKSTAFRHLDLHVRALSKLVWSSVTLRDTPDRFEAKSTCSIDFISPIYLGLQGDRRSKCMAEGSDEAD